MVIVLYLLFTYPLPTAYTLFIPWIVIFVAFSLGNWGQHIFVDEDKHDCNYRLTYNIMNSCINQQNFNDGYHVIHHYNARKHWTELPSSFNEEKVLKKHYEMGALTFNGDISFFDVTILVLSGNLQKLVEKYYVHIGPENECPTVNEVMKICQHRLKKFDQYVSAHYGGAGEFAKQKSD